MLLLQKYQQQHYNNSKNNSSNYKNTTGTEFTTMGKNANENNVVLPCNNKNVSNTGI
jgi:hypothetical protein